jgi:hypothetical protein
MWKSCEKSLAHEATLTFTYLCESQVKSLWHMKMHWLSYDSLCESQVKSLWHMKMHWLSHDSLCESHVKSL